MTTFVTESSYSMERDKKEEVGRESEAHPMGDMKLEVEGVKEEKETQSVTGLSW